MVRADPPSQLVLPHVLQEPTRPACRAVSAAPRPDGVSLLRPPLGLTDAISRELQRREVERAMVRAAGVPLVVRVTDNRRTMLSISRGAAVRVVRMHHMFLDAPYDVLDAVARYLAHGDDRACASIDQHIARNRHRIRDRHAPRPARVDPRGRVYDLDALRDALAARYFPEGLPVSITWGRDPGSLARGADPTAPRRARWTLRMGSYSPEQALIRIHPALDQPWVPRYFVEAVVFHEMLHHVVPMPVVDGRRCYHTPEFRERERLFHDFERARAWEREHLRELIASRHG